MSAPHRPEWEQFKNDWLFIGFILASCFAFAALCIVFEWISTH